MVQKVLKMQLNQLMLMMFLTTSTFCQSAGAEALEGGSTGGGGMGQICFNLDIRKPMQLAKLNELQDQVRTIKADLIVSQNKDLITSVRVADLTEMSNGEQNMAQYYLIRNVVFPILRKKLAALRGQSRDAITQLLNSDPMNINMAQVERFVSAPEAVVAIKNIFKVQSDLLNRSARMTGRRGWAFPPSEDSQPNMNPERENCIIGVQLAHQYQGKVRYAQDSYAKMDLLNKVMIELHEALYSTLLNYGVELPNSTPVRAWVLLLFQALALETDYDAGKNGPQTVRPNATYAELVNRINQRLPTPRYKFLLQ